MAKVTKALLQKENEALKNKVAELQNQVKQLEKEKLELKVRLEFWENLPKVAGDNVNNFCNWVGSMLNQPQGQNEKK